jgi:hypothetical protein
MLTHKFCDRIALLAKEHATLRYTLNLAIVLRKAIRHGDLHARQRDLLDLAAVPSTKYRSKDNIMKQPYLEDGCANNTYHVLWNRPIFSSIRMSEATH